MRNPLKRRSSTEPKISSRERLQAMKAKAREALLRKPVSTPQPDPIFAAIDEAKRLHVVWDEALALPSLPGSNDPHPDAMAAGAAFHGHSTDVLLKTVPRTAEGCAALARYAVEHIRRWGFALDEDSQADQHVTLLDLIARSPLL